MNINELMNNIANDDRNYTLWYYEGADTYLPCEENVRWFIVNVPMEISDD
jgi:carbonic anhydrase